MPTASHGLSKTKLYMVWLNMKKRCEYPKAINYNNYGGRGIKVCAEWQDFLVFRKWALENGYDPKLFLDRKESDKDYAPDNCRFVTRLVNNRNRTSTRKLTVENETKTIQEWCNDSRCSVDYKCIHQRLLRGWSVASAILTPA